MEVTRMLRRKRMKGKKEPPRGRRRWEKERKGKGVGSAEVELLGGGKKDEL